jgi:hypothetical protein
MAIKDLIFLKQRQSAVAPAVWILPNNAGGLSTELHPRWYSPSTDGRVAFSDYFPMDNVLRYHGYDVLGTLQGVFGSSNFPSGPAFNTAANHILSFSPAGAPVTYDVNFNTLSTGAVVSGFTARSGQFFNGLYVFAGVGGKIYTSTNGTTFTSRVSGTTSELTWTVIAGSAIYAFGVGAFLSSTDGINWAVKSTSPPALEYVVTDGANLYGILATNAPSVQIHKSTDGGATWSLVFSPSSAQRPNLNGQMTLAYANGALYAVWETGSGNDGSVYKSTDGGVTWAVDPTPASATHTTVINAGTRLIAFTGFGGEGAYLPL